MGTDQTDKREQAATHRQSDALPCVSVAQNLHIVFLVSILAIMTIHVLKITNITGEEAEEKKDRTALNMRNH